MAKRQISDAQSIRLGSRAYKTGEEDALYEQITPAQAKALKERGVLKGDWSGAKGAYQQVLDQQAEARAQRGPITRAVKQALDQQQTSLAFVPLGEETSQEEDGDPDEPLLEGMAQPFRLADEKPAGGWYSFRDANDEPLNRRNGEEYKVQGREDAELILHQLNEGVQ